MILLSIGFQKNKTHKNSINKANTLRLYESGAHQAATPPLWYLTALFCSSLLSFKSLATLGSLDSPGLQYFDAGNTLFSCVAWQQWLSCNHIWFEKVGYNNNGSTWGLTFTPHLIIELWRSSTIAWSLLKFHRRWTSILPSLNQHPVLFLWTRHEPWPP